MVLLKECISEYISEILTVFARIIFPAVIVVLAFESLMEVKTLDVWFTLSVIYNVSMHHFFCIRNFLAFSVGGSALWKEVVLWL